MSTRPRLFPPIRFFSILALVVVFFTSILSAQSSPVFNGPRDYPVGLSPNSMVVGDFNRDGRSDIATANQGSNNVSVLLQNSDRSFQAAVNYAVGKGGSSLQVGDVNGDGKLDLVLINSGDTTIGVLLGNGDGTFQTQKGSTNPANSTRGFQRRRQGRCCGRGTAAASWHLRCRGPVEPRERQLSGTGYLRVSGASEGLGVADINHDGKLDIVSAGSGVSVGISVLLGNGDGTFQSAINSATQSVYMALTRL